MEQRSRAVMSARGKRGRGSAGSRPRRKPFSSKEMGRPNTISCWSTIAAAGGGQTGKILEASEHCFGGF